MREGDDEEKSVCGWVCGCGMVRRFACVTHEGNFCCSMSNKRREEEETDERNTTSSTRDDESNTTSSTRDDGTPKPKKQKGMIFPYLV
jgi:hypothetical protein